VCCDLVAITSETLLRGDVRTEETALATMPCTRAVYSCDSSTVLNPVIRYQHLFLGPPLRPGNQVIFGSSYFH